MPRNTAEARRAHIGDDSKRNLGEEKTDSEGKIASDALPEPFGPFSRKMAGFARNAPADRSLSKQKDCGARFGPH